mmetsp:Transcript_15607/g.36330  ORF Transcript_15607/g.36330 Transcript_15607/m.36330 type:complete len:296 (-) Transcript_15607:61-948(-)
MAHFAHGSLGLYAYISVHTRSPAPCMCALRAVSPATHSHTQPRPAYSAGRLQALIPAGLGMAWAHQSRLPLPPPLSSLSLDPWHQSANVTRFKACTSGTLMERRGESEPQALGYSSCVENRRVTTAVRRPLLDERAASCASMSSAALASVPTPVLLGARMLIVLRRAGTFVDHSRPPTGMVPSSSLRSSFLISSTSTSTWSPRSRSDAVAPPPPSPLRNDGLEKIVTPGIALRRRLGCARVCSRSLFDFDAAAMMGFSCSILIEPSLVEVISSTISGSLASRPRLNQVNPDGFRL